MEVFQSRQISNQVSSLRDIFEKVSSSEATSNEVSSFKGISRKMVSSSRESCNISSFEQSWQQILLERKKGRKFLGTFNNDFAEICSPITVVERQFSLRLES